jgi:hypothetical protein
MTDDAAVMRRFIGLAMASPGPPAWDQLDPALVRSIRSTYFLLDTHAAGGIDAETVATRVLDRLMLQLRRTTERQQVSRRGQIAGRIVWPATLKARYGEEHDPTRYVSQRVRSDFDTTENQLVRYLIERLMACVRAVPAVIRAGASFYPAQALDAEAEPRARMSTAARLGRIEAALTMVRRDPRVRSVTLVHEVDGRHFANAEMADLQEYRAVAAMVRQYQAVVLETAWAAHVAAIGRRMLLLPGTVGADGEPWLRLGAGLLRGIVE